MGEHLGMHAVVLDGEVVAFGEDGRPSFARLQNRLHLADPKEARRRAAADPVQFVAFDVLYADGRSLLADPYDAASGPARGARLLGLQLHDDRVLPRRPGSRRAARPSPRTGSKAWWPSGATPPIGRGGASPNG